MDKELKRINDELKRAPGSIARAMKENDGAAERIIRAVVSDSYAEYPKANNGCFSKKHGDKN